MAPFTDPSPWVDGSSGRTPLDASHLNAAEQEVAAYADAAVAAITQVTLSPGNLGTAYSVPISATRPTILLGTLNANCTLTLTGIVAGATAELVLVQDATGGRTATLSDGTNTLVLMLNTAIGAVTIVRVTVAANGTDIYVEGA